MSNGVPSWLLLLGLAALLFFLICLHLWLGDEDEPDDGRKDEDYD